MSEFKVIRNGNPMRGADLGTEKSVLITVMAVAAQAKALQQPDTGALRNSIMWKVQKAKGGLNDSSGKKADVEISVSPQAMEGYVGSALNYSIYHEFGTRRARAFPYLRPAIVSIRARQFGEKIAAENIIEMRKAMGAGKKYGE